MVEEIKYCTCCGAVNKRSAVVCSNCKKKLPDKHYPIEDYIISHVKDSFKDKAIDSLFSLFKNFLLSHLYGTVLSVAIVFTAVTFAATSTPGVKVVSENPYIGGENTPVNVVEEVADGNLSEDEIDEINHATTKVAGQYWLSTYHSMKDSSMIVGGADVNAEECLVDMVIEDFPYECIHEAGYGEIVDVVKESKGGRYGGDNNIVTTSGNMTSELAKMLVADGYRVVERKWYSIIFNDELPEEMKSSEIDVTKYEEFGADAVFIYNVVFVEIDGEWYIAEDRLVRRV